MSLVQSSKRLEDRLKYSGQATIAHDSGAFGALVVDACLSINADNSLRSM